MDGFDRDRLRVIVCFAGLFGLFFQLVAETVFGASIGAGLTGTFGTLATLPFVDSAVEKFALKRGPTPPDDEPPPSPPSPMSPGDRTTDQPRSEQHRGRSENKSLAVAV